MTLDADICYHALQSRDARFDGRFFTGVRTTGIYCRPVCPARTPKQSNVTFYPSAAAAEAAGFRPCMRCRPETSPGTPAWSGTAASVTRALRLIDDGFLDGGSLEDLAGALGMTSRHVRRLFDQHLGASPVAVAQARRVHFARRLVAETTLPITEIAFGAGFASVRRFNTVFQRTFGRPPSAFRREKKVGAGSRGAQPSTRDAGMTLRLAARPPFDAAQVLGFIAPRAMPGVEEVDGADSAQSHSTMSRARGSGTGVAAPEVAQLSYMRVVRFGGNTGIIEVTTTPDGQLQLRIPSTLAPHALAAVERTRQMFDMKADPLAIAEHLSDDPILASLTARFPGVRVPGAWSPFETAVRAILGQQISVAGATTLAGRIVDRYGERVAADSDVGVTHLFPSPERLVRARVETLGLTKARARAIRVLARASAEGALAPGAELEEILERLESLDGIGPWTAHYVAMRVFGEPDAFPSGDLALRRAALELDPGLDTEKKLIARAESWRPWRAYATMLLWRHYMENEAAARGRPPSRGAQHDSRNSKGKKRK